MTPEFQDGGHDVILCISAPTWRLNMNILPAYATAPASS